MTHIYTSSCIDIILTLKYIWNRFCFSVNVAVLFSTLSLFLLTILLKLSLFYKLNIFQLISFCLLQSNLLQHFISFSIRKRQVQKPKLGLILFHIYGTMITLWGLMKKTDNNYDVIQVSKESILLRLLLTYWGRIVCILKVVMFLRTNLI